ncbi:alpha/beta hydrolase [uncultured Vagococcus sp.]|uniref:alpha/beta fold hydrolase n=1 Tax=uncultured Vagococcus sp. TaxID=189676 RepID=UPI0028D34A6F|nr:alpha/beta hydrolase [uncultured Vagococcus sp.]
MMEQANHEIDFFFREGENNVLMVFLSGFGGTCAYLDYKHIIDCIPDYIGILALDRFGYGKSTHSIEDRTLSNTSSEIDSVLIKLKLIEKTIIFVTHSLSGIYILDYINRYERTIIGLIFIEPTTRYSIEQLPHLREEIIFNSKLVQYLRQNTDLDLFSIIPLEVDVNPHLKEAEKKEYIFRLKSNFLNVTLTNEINESEKNIVEASNYIISDSVPVLLFTRECREVEYNNSNYLNSHNSSRIVSYSNGTHHIHWSNGKEVINEIKQFLENLLNCWL